MTELIHPKNEPQNNPEKSGEGRHLQSNSPDTEINPGRPATNTEVDLDKSKTRTYPDKKSPERQ
jgi:hypothetical protein